jgi:hypothetical protein
MRFMSQARRERTCDFVLVAAHATLPWLQSAEIPRTMPLLPGMTQIAYLSGYRPTFAHQAETALPSSA